ncbi:MAG TPA: YIP1 family protein [Terriglobia bacterium]|nr:YIP1 family protein [Terriglobia bacterium]
MSNPVMASPAEHAQPSKSFVERFIGVFISPGETFADIARKPDFIAPMIVLIVMTVAVTETMLAKIGMERIVRASMEQSSRASSMTPEQIDQAVSRGASIGAIIAHVSGFIGVPLLMVIIAALGLLFVNAIFGGQMKFDAALSVACYANLPSVLGAIMAVALIFFGDPEHFNATSPVPSNLGFFLDPLTTAKPLMVLASSLDIFTIWFMILLGIGYSAASGGKLKAVTIFLCFFGLRAVLLLAQMGLAMFM